MLKGEESKTMAILQLDVAQFVSSHLNLSCILELHDCNVVGFLRVSFDLGDAVNVLVCEQLLNFCGFHPMRYIVDIAKKLDWGFVGNRL